LADVEAICTRIGVMHHGALRFTCTPAEFKRHYVTADIEAAFLACTADVATC
jgi:ABC-2 type transport system ATP-binding protein